MNSAAIDEVLDAHRIAERMTALTGLLQSTLPLWRESAFRCPRLSWEADYPQLSPALRALTLEQSDALERDCAAAHDFLARWLPVEEWARHAALGRWPVRNAFGWLARFQRDIPGRKWNQIADFSAALGDAGLPCVEWCAGKAHLSRCLSRQWNLRPVTALERDDDLLREATRLAARAALPLEARSCDVMSDAVCASLGAHVQVFALHACGDLHRRLFDCAIASGVPLLGCAPCCYHLVATDSPPVLSRFARGLGFALEPGDWRSAVQEAVTSSGHARRRRRRVQQWQLGFDVLARELRGVDEYLPVPSVSPHNESGGFELYCRAAAQRHDIDLPVSLSFAPYEAAGRERFRVVTALDLVRHRFRRLLELWLVFDRALYLSEHGYHVGVAEFCVRELTPRNVLIQAWRT
jgi:Methyltransferase domain